MADRLQNVPPRRSAGLTAGTPVRFDHLVDYAAGSIVSTKLLQVPSGSLTLFAFDEGQELSEHTAPFDAIVHVLDGRVELRIGGTAVQAVAGESVLMPAGVPHAVKAGERFKMLLTMLRRDAAR